MLGKLVVSVIDKLVAPTVVAVERVVCDTFEYIALVPRKGSCHVLTARPYMGVITVPLHIRF